MTERHRPTMNNTMSILLAILVGVLIATALYAIAGYVPHAHCI